MLFMENEKTTDIKLISDREQKEYLPLCPVQVQKNTITEKDGKRLKNNTNAYAEVLVKALDVFENNPQKLQKMAESAMRKDFSWDVENSGIHLYHKLLTTGHL